MANTPERLGRDFRGRLAEADARQLAEYLNEGIGDQANVINVSRAEDFPAPDVTGKRTLAANTSYNVRGVVDLADTYLYMEMGAQVIGVSPAGSVLTNLRSDFLITGAVQVRSLTMICPLGVAMHLNAPSSVGVAVLCVVQSSREAVRVGEVGNFFLFAVLCSANQKDIVIEGPFTAGRIQQYQSVTTTGASFRGIQILPGAQVLGPLYVDGCALIMAGPDHVGFDFSDSATYPADQTSYLTQNSFQLIAGATALGGDIDKTDPRFNFRDNTNIEDSATAGCCTFSDNELEPTVITVAGQFERIGSGTPTHPPFSLVGSSERFDLVGTLPNQELRYTGLVPVTAVVTASVTAQKFGALTLEYWRTRIMRNGVPVEGGSSGSGTVSVAGSVTLSVPIVLQPGDQLWVEISNELDLDPLLVVSASITCTRTA